VVIADKSEREAAVVYLSALLSNVWHRRSNFLYQSKWRKFGVWIGRKLDGDSCLENQLSGILRSTDTQHPKKSTPPNMYLFIFRIVGGGVQAGSTRHVGHWMAYCTCPGWLWWWRIGGIKIGRGNRSIRRKPTPAPLCPPQIPLGQTWVWTRAAAVGSQRLTAWAMARPMRPEKEVPWVVGDGGTRDFPLSAYCCIPLTHSRIVNDRRRT
jgi:hypothetical protein